MPSLILLQLMFESKKMLKWCADGVKKIHTEFSTPQLDSQGRYFF